MVAAGFALIVKLAWLPSVTAEPPITVSTGCIGGRVVVSSSLVRRSCVGVTAPPTSVPETVMVCGSLATVSSTGVSVKVPAPESAPAGMVTLKLGTGWNPAMPSLLGPVTETVTVRSAPNRVVPCTVAVTVTSVAPASSETEPGLTLKATDDGAGSSSTTGMVALTGTPRMYPVPESTVTVTEPSGSSVLSPSVGIDRTMPDAAGTVLAPSSPAASTSPLWVTV